MEKLSIASTDNQQNATINSEATERYLDNDRYIRHSQHLLMLFPEEVWVHICNFLYSTDFLNLINSSPFFRELFLGKRVAFFYKPVLEVLLLKLGKRCSNQFATDNHLCKPNEYNVSQLTLKSRLVCKAWKQIIDEKASIWNGGKPESNGLVHNRFAGNYTFSFRWHMDKFITKFENTHPPNINPFVGKYFSLFFRASDDPEFVQASTGVSNILDKYGHHLLTLKIGFSFRNRNIPEPHRKVIEWLNHVPNLQNLAIDYKVPFVSYAVQPVEVGLMPPQLKSLRKLVVTTKRPNVSDNRLFEWSWLERYHLSQLIQVQENLEFLKIVMVSKSDFKILETIKSPLKTLLVCYICKEDDISLSEMLSTLSEKFANSLENLMVKFSQSVTSPVQMNIIRASFYERLRLPKLKAIDLRISNPCCLDFLLEMQDSLEELKITGVCKNYSYKDFSMVEKREIELFKEDQIVKYLGFEDNLLESNIWSVFPKLQKISLNTNGKGQEILREDWLKVQNSN